MRQTLKEGSMFKLYFCKLITRDVPIAQNFTLARTRQYLFTSLPPLDFYIQPLLTCLLCRNINKTSFTTFDN